VRDGETDQDDALARSVFIENVPDDMCDFLEVVIENRNSGGGLVELYEPDPVRSGVLVRFVDQQGWLTCLFLQLLWRCGCLSVCLSVCLSH